MINKNSFLEAWDTYVADSDEMFTQEEYLAFKNGWVFALDFIMDKSRECWNDATYPERSKVTD